MNKSVIFTFFIPCLLFAQQDPAQKAIPKDTSFTNYSAAVKVYKKFPDARLAIPSLPEDANSEENLTFVSYGQRDLKLDVYSPSRQKGISYPAVIFVHGGGWRSGDRSQEKALAQKLCGNGYVAILPEYRLSIEELYPAAIYDVKAAVRWARANSEKYNIDTNKIAILGCSAGGELASFIGTTGGVSKFEGKSGNPDHQSSVQAIVNIDGLVDFTNIESTKYDTDSLKPSSARLWFGSSFKDRPDLWKEASPITYVSNNTPPVIFINSSLEHYHAGRDDMIEKLKEHNIYYEVHTIPDSPHPFWLFHPWFDQTYEYVLGFLDKVFEKNITGRKL